MSASACQMSHGAASRQIRAPGQHQMHRQNGAPVLSHLTICECSGSAIFWDVHQSHHELLIYSMPSGPLCWIPRLIAARTKAESAFGMMTYCIVRSCSRHLRTAYDLYCQELSLNGLLLTSGCRFVAAHLDVIGAKNTWATALYSHDLRASL